MKKLDQLMTKMNNLPRKQATLLIGIDGCGGSGKSTLAARLKENLPGVTVVHMDDFYLPSNQKVVGSPEEKPVGADCDWRRVLHQVIEPLSRDQEGNYQRYDWVKDALAEWHQVPVGGIVIIEGVYSTRNELLEYYDFTIWVETPRETRLSRGLERDGEEARDRWEKDWMVAEDIYVKAHKPHERADLVIAGTN